jgi:hypothetical protein
MVERLKIIFFSPYANVWDHSLIEYGFSESLSELGHEVTLISCSGELLPQCIATLEVGIDFESTSSSSKQICLGCQKRSSLLKSNFKQARYIDFSELLTQPEMDKIESELLGIDSENYIEFTFENMLVGPIAFYEFSLKHKLRSLKLTSNQFKEYTHQLRNVLKTQVAIGKAIDTYAPECVIVHNSLYSTNRIVELIAKKRNIKTFSIGGSQNFSSHQAAISLYSSPQEWIGLSHSKAWQAYYKNVGADIDWAASNLHFENIMNAQNPFTYSSAAVKNDDDQLRNFFGIQEKQKVYLATLSSEDELFSANLIGVVPDFRFGEASFESQFEWIEFLIEFFKNNQDLTLIIRVHPREFPNKRDLQEASSVTKWREVLINPPSNVHVNWPTDGISVYQLAGITDLVLNWRSTVGIEFLALGIPVLVPSCSNLLSYPIEFNSVAETRGSYLEKIVSAADAGASFENIRNAFIWISFLSNIVSLPINSTARLSQSLTSIRPKSTGFRLRVWNCSTSIFLKHAPLWLEKKSIQNWKISRNTGRVLSETIISGNASVADTVIKSNKLRASSSYETATYENLHESLLSRLSLMYANPSESKIWSNLKDKQ